MSNNTKFLARIDPCVDQLPKVTDRAGYIFRAPVPDADGNKLYVGSIVTASNGVEGILHFGPYTAHDEDGIYDGWGWYFEFGKSEDNRLYYYSIQPFTKDSGSNVTLKRKKDGSPADRPDWWLQYLAYNTYVDYHNEQILKGSNVDGNNI